MRFLDVEYGVKRSICRCLAASPISYLKILLLLLVPLFAAGQRMPDEWYLHRKKQDSYDFPKNDSLYHVHKKRYRQMGCSSKKAGQDCISITDSLLHFTLLQADQCIQETTWTDRNGDCLHWFNEACNYAPNTEALNARAAYKLYRMHDEKGAAADWETSLAMDNHQWSEVLALANMYNNQMDFAKASAWFSHLATEQPQYFLSAANCSVRGSMLSRAEESYRKYLVFAEKASDYEATNGWLSYLFFRWNKMSDVHGTLKTIDSLLTTPRAAIVKNNRMLSSAFAPLMALRACILNELRDTTAASIDWLHFREYGSKNYYYNNKYFYPVGISDEDLRKGYPQNPYYYWSEAVQIIEENYQHALDHPQRDTFHRVSLRPALQLLQKAESLGLQQPRLLGYKAMAYWLLGDKPRAWEWLKSAEKLANRDQYLTLVRERMNAEK